MTAPAWLHNSVTQRQSTCTTDTRVCVNLITPPHDTSTSLCTPAHHSTHKSTPHSFPLFTLTWLYSKPHTSPYRVTLTPHHTSFLTNKPPHLTLHTLKPPQTTPNHPTPHLTLPCTSAHHPTSHLTAHPQTTTHLTLHICTPHHSTSHAALHGSLPLLMVLEVHSCSDNLWQAVNSLVHLPGEEAVGLQTHRQTDKTWSGGS